MTKNTENPIYTMRQRIEEALKNVEKGYDQPSETFWEGYRRGLQYAQALTYDIEAKRAQTEYKDIEQKLEDLDEEHDNLQALLQEKEARVHELEEKRRAALAGETE